uniref:Uncharacterized protein n=1 Tax=Steinernema glaseri TaxID=37863 RepID=A0A1I7XYA7_9BILA
MEIRRDPESDTGGDAGKRTSDSGSGRKTTEHAKPIRDSDPRRDLRRSGGSQGMGLKQFVGECLRSVILEKNAISGPVRFSVFRSVGPHIICSSPETVPKPLSFKGSANPVSSMSVTEKLGEAQD